jgi:hypothetical protein
MTQFTKLTTTRLTIAMALFIGVGVAQAEVPVVQAPEVIELEFGRPFEYTLKASNDPLGFSIKGLPFWLEREGDILRGTPVSTKEHALTVYALNADGVSEPRKVKLRIADTADTGITQVAKSKTETP